MDRNNNKNVNENRIIEICCGSYEDALAAFKGGAKRIELNSALYLGGLTPSLGALILTKKNTSLKVISMVRPRGAGFCYSDEDFEVMKADAALLMENGSDGIAFGCLTSDCMVDEKKTGEIINIIKKYNGEAVFHRAFDCVKDPYKAMEKLIELGAHRVLTSGQEQKAIDGICLLADLQKKYGDKIQILAGSGVNSSNALEIMEKTGISQVHSSCKDWKKDSTTEKENSSMSFAYAPVPHREDYEVVSRELVEKLTDRLHNL